MTPSKEVFVGESAKRDAHNLDFQREEWRIRTGSSISSERIPSRANEQQLIVPATIEEARELCRTMTDQVTEIRDKFTDLKQNENGNLSPSQIQKTKAKLRKDNGLVVSQLRLAKGYMRYWANATREEHLESVLTQVDPLLQEQITCFREIKLEIREGRPINDEEQKRVDDFREYLRDEITNKVWGAPIRSLLE